MEVGPQTPVRELLNLTAFITPCTTVCRTGIVRELGGFYDQDRSLYGEDAFLWAKLLLNYPVSIDLRPMAQVHRDASELSGNYSAARPVEPFLERPELVRAACPEAKRKLLSVFLASRAFKTAAVLSYWGDWRAADALRRRFRLDGTITTPYYWTSLAASTPVGPIAGYWLRKMKLIRR